MSAPPTGIKQVLKEALKTKTGMAAVIILGMMVAMSLSIPIYSPADFVKKWNDLKAWYENPSLAAPVWVKWFTGADLPETIDLKASRFRVDEEEVSGHHITTYTAYFRYSYDDYPSELKAFIKADIGEKPVRLNVMFVRADGEEITLFNGLLSSNELTLDLSLDPKLQKSLARFLYEKTGAIPEVIRPEIVLFSKSLSQRTENAASDVLKGRYMVKFQLISDRKISAEPRFIIYGKVFGLAGTDLYRRDLWLGIIWGAPVALAFGTVAAVATALLQVVIGAAGAWFGPKWDELVQRLADFLLIIPVLPILILISVIYRVTIWSLLGWVILFSIVGVSSKIARSITFQIREEQYIEAARTYGASKTRMLFYYVIPRIMPFTFALVALSVPTYIFLEAALSFLGLGDPELPTWGRILGDAYSAGALYQGYWWWVILPAFMIMLVSLGFTLLSYAFDKIVNPRLREE